MKIQLIGIGENILNVNNQEKGKGFKTLIANKASKTGNSSCTS